MESDYFDEGCAAFIAGYPKDANPYAEGTTQHEDWLRGWVATDDSDDKAEAVD